MKTQRPIVSSSVSSDGEHRVLQFRPRTLATPGQRRNQSDPIEQHGVAMDLSRYERDREEPDDYRAIRFGYRYADILDRTEDGRLRIDYSRFHETIEE